MNLQLLICNFAGLRTHNCFNSASLFNYFLNPSWCAILHVWVFFFLILAVLHGQLLCNLLSVLIFSHNQCSRAQKETLLHLHFHNDKAF